MSADHQANHQHPWPGEFSFCPHCATPLLPNERDGRTRQRCPECDFIHWRNPGVGAAAVVFNHQGHVLLVRRAAGATRSGFWSIPAGFVDYGEEIRAAAMDTGASIWVEKIVFETQPDLDVDALMEGDDPIAHLIRAVRGAADDDDALSEIMGSLKSLTTKLPAEYRQFSGAIDLESREGVSELLRGVEKCLLPQLLGIREQE